MKSFNDLLLAPPSKIVDNLLAVPVDIGNLNARLIFDASNHRAEVESTLTFTMGQEDGNPIFDLRQDIESAWLNDEHFPPGKLKHHDFGGGSSAGLRIAERNLAAESTNTLELHYKLNKPQSSQSRTIGWTSNHLFFDLWFSDLWPGRYLEMWFPSNLIYDKFAFDLEIRIINTDIEHVLFSNGKIEVLGRNHWKVAFPERFTSLSHMLCIAGKAMVDSVHSSLTLPDTGKGIDLQIFKLKSTPADLPSIESKLKEFIESNVLNIGEYIHGEKYVNFIWEDAVGRSMEYDGASTTLVKDLKHEVFHSWFARGIKPATQNDSWLDEGWTVYNTSENFQQIQPFDLSEDPVLLSSPSKPYNRITPPEAYRMGSRFFAGLANVLGKDNLHSYMRSFYDLNKRELTTTKQLQDFLIQQSGGRNLETYFNRFVFGRKN